MVFYKLLVLIILFGHSFPNLLYGSNFYGFLLFQIHPVYVSSCWKFRNAQIRLRNSRHVKVKTQRGYREYVCGRRSCTANREYVRIIRVSSSTSIVALRYYTIRRYVVSKLLHRYIFFRICVLAGSSHRVNTLYHFVNCDRADRKCRGIRSLDVKDSSTFHCLSVCVGVFIDTH